MVLDLQLFRADVAVFFVKLREERTLKPTIRDGLQEG